MNKKKSNILVAPLNWGLGHAMRCIPLINELLKSGVEVILAADGRPYDLLHTEFPGLRIIRLPGQKITYSKKSSFLKMLKIVPAFYHAIKIEHKALQHIIQKYNIHAVISDNRYGLYSYQIPSIFIGHQMMIKMPLFLKWSEWFIHKLNMRFIQRFNECWIPDYQGSKGLSGDLAHKYQLPENFYFIGPLSRFNNEDTITQTNKDPLKKELLVILSGPEPQRSILEEKLLHQLQSIDRKAIVVRGVTEQNRVYAVDSKTRIIDHADTAQLRQLIRKSGVIICRSGYSGIMDLAATGKRAILIPTPGQTEQEYLAAYFYRQQVYYCDTQKKINLKNALQNVPHYPGIQKQYDSTLLRNRIRELVSKTEN
ncbi:MAG: glycosyltransferase [Bacteroidales bacterium]